VHILIIPKKHITDLNEVADGDLGLLASILKTAKDLAKKEGVSGTGYRLNLNVGADAGQAVSHIHFHLLGGRKFNWPPG
jgi:histidine triad (HIT) family protein